VIEYFSRRGDPRFYDLWECVRDKENDLENAISKAKKIYLDVNSWIGLRRVLLDEETHSVWREMLDRLSGSVANGKVLCPISDDLVLEFAKQDDQRTRGATEEVAQNLSRGTAIRDIYERIEIEAHNYFLHLADGTDADKPLRCRRSVWTKIGLASPSFRFPEDEIFLHAPLDAQRRFVDIAWGLPVSYSVEFEHRHASRIQNAIRGISEFLQDNKVAHEQEIGTFQNLLNTEFLQGVDETARIVFVGMNAAWAATTRLGIRGVPGIAEDGHELSELLAKDGGLLPSLRSCYCYALAHAVHRFEKSKKYKYNEVHDLHHASTAIAYFDLFVTEKGWATMLRNRSEVAETSKCKVAHDAESALRTFEELGI
jgi:hypothetical protein